MKRRSGWGTIGGQRWSGTLPATIRIVAMRWPTCACPTRPWSGDLMCWSAWSTATCTRKAKYPFGNWEYQRFYEEHFEKATGAMEANVAGTFKTLFRSGNPEGKGKPALLSQVRREGGWFGGKGAAPNLPRDERVITENDLHAYASAYERTSFFGTDSLYMNHAANARYASEALNDGYIDLPVLFLEAEYDYTCDCVNSPLAEPMK